MMSVSRGAVWTAALVLVGAASVGSYLGYSRAVAAPGGSADSDTYVAPLAAKKATSVDSGPAPPPPVDENYIRKIAHDEAVAVVHPLPKKVHVAQASDDSDDDDDSSDDKSPGANPPTPPPTAPAPAPAAAPKPPPPPTGLY